MSTLSHLPALVLQCLFFELFKTHALEKERKLHLLSSCQEEAFASDPLSRCCGFAFLLEDLFPKQRTKTKKVSQALLKIALSYHREKALSSQSPLFFPLTKKRKKPPPKKNLHLLHATYDALLPLLLFCKNNENLFLFLLKNRGHIDELRGPSSSHALFTLLYPDNLEEVGEKMCNQYHQRGFLTQIPECKLLLSELLNERRAAPSRC